MIQEEPLVTVITPSFNQGRFLEQTIRSVITQDYPKIEYIVMDGGSDDNSLDIIRRYEDRLTYWESVPDEGQAHAINKGLKRAKGEILGWLNADDILLPESLSRVVEVFKEKPNIDVVYGRLERIDESGLKIPTPILPKDKVIFSKQLVIGECVVNQPGSFWRRRIMEKAGTLDESLRYALDYEYWIRLALKGARFWRVPEVVARFRLSSVSKTVGETAEMACEQLGVLENLLSRPGLTWELDIDSEQLQRKARRARSTIGLHAFYGRLKQRRWRDSWHWLSISLKSDPGVIFKKRWLDLAISSLARRSSLRGE